ncbi:hypothetical protein D3C76_1036990 [compost metagenome]
MQILRRLVARVGEDHVVDDFGDPAELTLVEILLGFLEDRLFATHHLDIMLATFFRWQLMQLRRIAGEPAQVQHVGGLDVVVHRTVVATVGELVGDRLGQFELLGDLDHGVTLVDHPQGFIVDVAVHVALGRQLLADLLVAPDRPVVHGVHHLDIVAPQFERLVEVF